MSTAPAPDPLAVPVDRDRPLPLGEVVDLIRSLGQYAAAHTPEQTQRRATSLADILELHASLPTTGHGDVR